MWTNDPVNDFLRHDEEQEAKMQEWLESRPVCPICGEHIGEEDVIDFSDGDMEEGYVYHADCLFSALKYKKLNMTRGEELYDLISDKFLRRAG